MQGLINFYLALKKGDQKRQGTGHFKLGLTVSLTILYRFIERETDREKERETDRERQRETERDRERQRETERGREFVNHFVGVIGPNTF